MNNYYKVNPPQLHKKKGFIFMTVPKSKRRKSRFEVFHNMQALQKELVKHLMQDFGITRIADLGEAQFLDLKFERVINLCGDIVGDIHRANAMYVSNMLEYEERRLYQDKAIGNCVVLKQELQSIIDIISGLNLNKYKASIELIEKEIHLIKSWRKSDLRLKKKLIAGQLLIIHSASEFANANNNGNANWNSASNTWNGVRDSPSH